MANVKISELSPLITVQDADVLPIVDNAVTKKVTAAILRSYTQGNSVLLTGAQTVAGIKTFTAQLASSVATGTAPFSVASTTKVTNLNADLLDGLSSADFALSTRTLTAGTGLTGGGDLTANRTFAIDSTVATLTGTQTLTNKTITSPVINEILDSNGNEILGFTPIASATDYITIKNGIGVGVPLHISAAGSSANTGIHLEPKGTGLVQISDGTDTTKGIRFRSSGSAASAITLLDAVSSAGRVITLPDATTTLVGTNTTDTLSNKSISGATNTLSNIGNASLTNSAITINGTSTSLGGSINVGTVTSVAALTLGTSGTDVSSSVATGTTTPVITLNVPTASASNRGALSSTDWSTFNAKQNAITLTTTGTSGAATLVGATLNIPNYADTDTGITSLNGLTALTQTFAVGTSGTDFGISSATSTHTFNLPTASAANRGALSSADWTTFNNKQTAGNYITALTGEASASGPGSSSITLTNSAVVGKILTGLNVTGGSVSATDSILDAFGKVQNQINSLIGGTIYKGTWNASTNTPTLTSSVGTQGFYYIVSVAGATNLNGITDWNVGDWAIFDGTAWQKVDNTDSVVSVNGLTGAVSLTTSNITEGTNLYYTEARVDANSNVAANTAARHNAVTLGTANGLSLSTQALSLGLASGSTNGALSSTDWTTFNNKTSNLGTVTSVGLTSATSGVTIGASPVTTSGDITLAIATASGSLNGLLSSTDWTTFNNKASTAALANYLPLAGGTLTGALNGTSAVFSSTINTGGNLLINNLSVSKKGYKFQSPSSNWSPQESGIFFTPADGVNAATTFSVELWDGNGNTTNALSIASTGAATFSSSVTAGQGKFYSGSSSIDGLIVAGAGGIGTTSQGVLRFGDAGNIYKIQGGQDYGAINFLTNNTTRFSIADTGVATFSGQVNIGTTTAYSNLNIGDGSASSGISIRATSGSTPVTIPTKGLQLHTGYGVSYISSYNNSDALSALYFGANNYYFNDGPIAISNSVTSAVAVASTHKVQIVINGTTYYLLATT